MAIYIIDGHPLMQEAIAMLLRRLQPDSEYVTLSRLSELERVVTTHGTPELFCTELALSDVTGIEAVQHLAAHHPGVPLAVITATPAREAERASRAAGASTYIEKTADSAAIIDALWPLMPGNVGTEAPPPEEIKLSRRQTQLLALLDKGLSNREIAERLSISEHTVKVHLWRLFRRLDVKSRTQVLHFARTNGLLGS